VKNHRQIPKKNRGFKKALSKGGGKLKKKKKTEATRQEVIYGHILIQGDKKEQSIPGQKISFKFR